MKAIVGAAILSAAVFGANGAQAARILAPESVQVVNGGTAGIFWAVDNIIDQSGLSKTYAPGVTDFDDFIASNRKRFRKLLKRRG